MKYILSTILISLILTSCSTPKEQQSIISSVPVIQSGIIQADTIVSSISINTGIISTGSAIAKIRTLGMENNNVVLLEDGIEPRKLTTKMNAIKDETGVDCNNPPANKNWELGKGWKNYFSYKIINQSQKYGVVSRTTYKCGGSYQDRDNLGVEQSIFVVNIQDQSGELAEIYSGAFDNVKVKDDTLILTNTDEVVNSENEEQPGMIAKSTLIKEGYKQQGKDWIKEMPFEKQVLKIKNPETKIPVNQSEVSENNINGIYTFQAKNSYNGVIIASIIINNNNFEWTMKETNWNDNNIGSSRDDAGNGNLQLKATNIGVMAYDNETGGCNGSSDISITKSSIIISRSIGSTCTIPNGTYKKQ